MDIEITPFYGIKIADWANQIAEMRISQFKEFPYLYAGDMDAEIKYLSHYSSHHHGLLVSAFHSKKLIGIVTGIPLYGVN